jgi:hypothetical protein
VHRRAHVQVDDSQVAEQLSLGERAAGTDARVDRGRGQWPSNGKYLLVEVLDPVVCSEVHLYGVDGGAQRLEIPCGIGDAGVFGVDDQVEVVLGELLGQFLTDAAGGAGDQSRWSLLVVDHDRAPSFVRANRMPPIVSANPSRIDGYRR